MAEISLIYRENVGGGNDDGVWRWRKTESHYQSSSSWLRRLPEIRHQGVADSKSAVVRGFLKCRTVC